MDFHHRKLMPEPDQENSSTITSQFCQQKYCAEGKDYRYCLPECFSICPEYCLNAPPPIHHKITASLVITISLLSAAFLIALIFVVFLRFRRILRRRTQNHQDGVDDRDHEHDHQFLDEEHGPVLDHPIWYIRTVGLQPSVISAITVCKYKKSYGLIEGTDCSVCLSEFQEDETLRILPKCSHAFHIPCIDTWLCSHTNCPMCRAPIVMNTTRTPLVENNSDDSGENGETEMGSLQNHGEFDREEEEEEEGNL